MLCTIRWMEEMLHQVHDMMQHFSSSKVVRAKDHRISLKNATRVFSELEKSTICNLKLFARNYLGFP